MLLRQTLRNSDGEIISQDQWSVGTEDRELTLRGIVQLWQSSPKTRQRIIESQTIPRAYACNDGPGRINGDSYVLESGDLKDLLRLFKEGKNTVSTPNDTTDGRAAAKKGFAELDAVYSILAAQVV